MLSFAALLRYPFHTPLGGVICLGGINPYDIEGQEPNGKLSQEKIEIICKIPVFMYIGDQDCYYYPELANPVTAPLI